MIAIIDYGAGNVKSLQFALTKENMDSCLTTDPKRIQNSKAIILPGVGAFNDAMETLHKLGLIEVLKQEVAAGKPVLGICLGMQLFYETSYEDGSWDGLGLLQGEVSRISSSVKVPHMGWNNITQEKESPWFTSITDNAYVYFVHSYAVSSFREETLLASTDYGGKVPAIVQKDNITGIQFHPEKSGTTGMQLLQNFGEMMS
ncbi:imidazole glycerol phosphate synthase subunit HisH [Virgibacillus sp. NKC19-3]|uniref:imidazole glycerol phosphate synthase subunit HisH n=1 Tax=Virgibacillus saliphilus TaxID=2831674 RepID=UPI001C9B8B67|nr:imidazole glycerol phosphate synthase subunit HisH [Virgibacillus sp. NKC19-3]MBY7142240.1 imidazole glycerol phosphate synthase subunit HisH [Virgibacillus sp. NKC19-3]